VSEFSVILTGGEARVPASWTEPVFTCRITGPAGWLDLDDHEHYIVAGDSFQAAQQTWRRQQITSPYVAGKFTTHAVPDTVQEQVNVWVLGINQGELQDNLAQLIDTFSQPEYDLVWSADQAAYTWHCEMADYSIDYSNTLLFARQLSFKAQIPRSPVVGMGPLS